MTHRNRNHQASRWSVLPGSIAAEPRPAISLPIPEHCKIGRASCRESVDIMYVAGRFFQAEDGIRDFHVTGVQTCALPIYLREAGWEFFQLTKIAAASGFLE